MSDEDFDLTENEIKVLEILGKLNISNHKNVRENSIRERLPSKYHKELPNTIKCLRSKGLLRKYRKENYELTKEGSRVAHELADRLTKKLYSSLRILLVL